MSQLGNYSDYHNLEASISMFYFNKCKRELNEFFKFQRLGGNFYISLPTQIENSNKKGMVNQCWSMNRGTCMYWTLSVHTYICKCTYFKGMWTTCT